jgi:XTP/dITP diphosphohydrolase
MTSLIFATANAHKLAELRAILPDYDIKGLKDIGMDVDIPETGMTLEENACIKAKYLYDQSGRPSLSEDTGLEVDSLGGNPGVHTARYAGEQRNPMDNMKKLLKELATKDDRSAQFRTVIAMVVENQTLYFEGIVRGKIAHEISGTEGFGYDPIFIPNGYESTFAELSSDIKNTISHRASAVKKLIEYLQAN